MALAMTFCLKSQRSTTVDLSLTSEESNEVALGMEVRLAGERRKD